MAVLIFVLSAVILLIIKSITLANRSQQFVMPSFLWVGSGILYVTILGICFYFSFLTTVTEGLRGYGSLGWLLIIASLSGLFFVLFMNGNLGINILRNFAIIILVPVLAITCIAALHTDEKKSRVFYEDGKYRIQKKDLAMYLVTLPQLVVKHGISETYYSIDNVFRIPQEKLLSATVQPVSADSLNIVFGYRPDTAIFAPNPFVVGIRIR
ncbi:MAG: hypothetical protein ABIX01_04010 [Chitinophagaceae bacterium]